MKIRRTQSRLTRCLALVALAGFAACSDDPGTAPIAITLSLSPTSVTLSQGGTATVGVTVSRTGSAGAVNITAAGLPSGVTAGALSIADGSTTGTLTLTATPAATTGTAQVVVRASATGASDVTQNLSLTVNATSTGPGSFTMTASPTAVTIAAGASGTSTLTLARTAPFTGAVALTATAPTGITVTFNPPSVTGTSSTATIAVASTVTAGSYSVTVTGNAGVTGIANQSATLTLTVTGGTGTASIALSTTPTTLSVAQGGSGTTTVNVTRNGGFTGAVALTASGGPTGTTFAFNPASATGANSTLTVTVPAGAATGNSTVTVTGSGTGVSNATVTFTLTVTAASAGFTLSLGGTAPTIAQNGSGSVTYTINRGTYTGVVNFAVTGVPTGVTATFNPAAVTGTSTTLNINVGASAPVGTHTLTVIGSTATLAPGQTSSSAMIDVTATLTLTITAGGGGGGNTTLTFCGTTGIPIAVYYQNGTSGPWTAATGSGSMWTANITADLGGIAFVWERDGTVTTTVFHGTRAEIQGYSSQQCGTSTGSKTVNLAVSGLSPLDQAGFSLGNSVTIVTGAAGGTGTFSNVRTGPIDFFGGKTTINLQTFALDITRVYMERGINPAAGSTVSPNLDGPNSGTPAQASLTVNGINGENTIVTGTYWTAGGFFGVLSIDGIGSTSASRTWKGFPTSMQQSGDVHLVQATANVNNGAFSRTAGIYTAAVANRTVTLGPALSAVTVSRLGTASPLRLQASVARQSEYASMWSFNASQGTRTLTVNATVGYIGSASPVVLTWPDFQGVAGFMASWLPTAGSPINWNFGGTGYSSSNPISDGSLIFNAVGSGSITP